MELQQSPKLMKDKLYVIVQSCGKSEYGYLKEFNFKRDNSEHFGLGFGNMMRPG